MKRFHDSTPLKLQETKLISQRLISKTWIDGKPIYVYMQTENFSAWVTSQDHYADVWSLLILGIGWGWENFSSLSYIVHNYK